MVFKQNGAGTIYPSALSPAQGQQKTSVQKHPKNQRKKCENKTKQNRTKGLSWACTAQGGAVALPLVCGHSKIISHNTQVSVKGTCSRQGTPAAGTRWSEQRTLVRLRTRCPEPGASPRQYRSRYRNRLRKKRSWAEAAVRQSMDAAAKPHVSLPQKAEKQGGQDRGGWKEAGGQDTPLLPGTEQRAGGGTQRSGSGELRVMNSPFPVLEPQNQNSSG